MKCYNGKAAFQGVAIGRIVEFKKEQNLVRRVHIENPEKEKKRFADAQAEAMRQLDALYEKALKEVGQTNAAIFEVHKMMLEDDDYVESVVNIIAEQLVNAEYAVATTGDNFSQMFAATNDAYMKERASDVKDISERVVRILSGKSEDSAGIAEGSIIVADDLAPSETVQLDKSKVVAFVTREGSTNSHTAILARTMNIPAIVNVPVPNDLDGETAIVNGMDGTVLVQPDEKTIADYKNLQQKEIEKRNLLQEYKGRPTATKSGNAIKLYANIGGVSDLGAVLQNDASGIGLFRSEFLYLQEDSYPSEETQFQAYKQVAETMAGKKVIIRTLDIGADKQIDYFNLDKEENPALGYRALRICLTREELFKTQLRALLRASAYGNLAIMVPMVISLWEVKKVKQLIGEVKAELKEADIPFKDIEFGVMIETPASVMIADELAKEVDFFSIGTNDLTQYTLAIDRQNPKLDVFYNPHHPAILKMIQMVIDAAHKQNIWAGICGELGADLELTKTFLKMGIDELSVSPSMVLPIRKKICEMD